MPGIVVALLSYTTPRDTIVTPGRSTSPPAVLGSRLADSLISPRAVQSIRVTYFGEAYLMANRMENATQCADQAIDLSRKHKERGHEAWAVRLEAEIASPLGPSQFEASEV